MSRANALQDSNSKVTETTFQPTLIVGTSEKKDSLRILHVDDDLGILEVSKQILTTENNFEIENAFSVDEAFEKLEKQTYDAIVSDYEMPIKNGLEFLRELREQHRETPFILFTGKGREDVAVKALNLGADSYINKNGSPETIYCELADAINKTVERKKSKQLLVESEMKYRTLVEKSLQGILITQTSPLRLVFANESMGKILGYSTDELKSLSPLRVAGLIYDEDKAVFFSRLESRLHGEPADSSLEFRAVRKNGSIVWLEAFASRIEYMGQVAVQGIFLDIDERKKVNGILRESEEKYRELANCLPEIVFETDLNGQLVFANERASEISGYSHEELEKGMNVLQFLAPEDRERAMKSIQRLLAGGNYVPAEYVFVRKDGTTFPALITTTRRISKNKVTGLRGLVLDITERKTAEESVRKSEQRYLELANFLPETVFETDLNGNITFFSQGSFELTGFTKEELEKGRNMLSFVVPEDLERAKENLKKVFSGEKRESNEFTLYKKNGDTYPAIVSATPIFSEGRAIGIRGLAIDITERKKTEEAIRLSEEKYRSLFENASDVILTGDLSGKIISINEAIKKYGFEKEQVVGKNVSDFLSIEDGVRQNKNFPEVGDGKSLFGELATVISVGKNVFEVKTDPLRIKGRVVGFQTILRDVSERKKTEETLNRTMNELVSVDEKLGVVGSLTRHDVRNKLSAVTGNAYLLKKKHADQQDIVEGLGKMQQICKEIDAIFEFARIYEQLGVEELTYVDVEKTLNEAVALFSSPLGLEVINDCRGLTLLADSFLRQLFYNLIDNSLKHGERVAKVRVYYEKVDQNKLSVVYEDDGVGIPAEIKPLIFKEGFSTSGSTGFGLFLIKQMIEVYGWDIQENGEPGKGAKFTIKVSRINQNGKEKFQLAR
jgi:PAS domain S-box-containing protein